MLKKHPIVMLPTKEASCIVLMNTGELYYKNNYSVNHEKERVNQHLYFLSDEEIKVGDWYYNTAVKEEHLSYSNYIEKCEYNHEAIACNNINLPKCYKIIASTDKSLGLPLPTDEFIKEYCKAGGIGEVMIEYYNDNEDAFDLLSGKICISPDNTITIKRIKENWSREDLYKAYMKGREHEYEVSQFKPDGKTQCKYVHPKESFDKWIQENI